MPKAKRCTHAHSIMVAYVSGIGAPHSSCEWCPACGALGWQHYSKGDAREWTAPAGPPYPTARAGRPARSA